MGMMRTERLDRLRVARGHVCLAIVRARTREELLRRTSEALVEHGALRAVWLGREARAGDESGDIGGGSVFSVETGGIDLTVLDAAGGFTPEENEVFSSIASDLAIGLARLAAEDVSARFASILESTDASVIGETLDGTISSWNSAARRTFGYEAEEIIGRPTATLVPPDRIELEATVIARLLRGERLDRLETRRVRKDGSTFPVSIAVSPSWSANGLVGVTKIIRDTTFATELVEALPGLFYLYDEAGHFVRWNKNFERVSGYDAEELAKMHPRDLFGPVDGPRLEQKIAEVFAKGDATIDASLVSKDGEAHPHFFTGKRIVLDGAPHLVGVGVDIAERKLAEDEVRRSAERYRTTLDSMIEGCQLVGFDWRYLYLNPAVTAQLRRTADELVGRRLFDAWPRFESTPTFALLRRCMSERVSVRDELEIAFADGTSAWFDVRVHPVPEGAFVQSIDITARRRSEIVLRELNESLERKVEARTRELEAARTRAEAADKIKSAFLATMSHELRTPLNSILGFTGIVLKEMAGPLTAEQSKQLTMVQGSARHLLALINDVLDISKIEAGQLEVRLAPFDLHHSVEQVVASMTPHATRKGLTLHTISPELPEPMVSDRRRVEQIMLNLLNNAIKFTDRGGVSLVVELLAGNDAVEIRVTDTGIGMGEEDLPKLFEPFRQLDSGLERQHEGSGLGLAICRRLAELLGGTIRASSVAGQGSVFTATLPTRFGEKK